jgi:hypothetical protein
MAGVDIQRDHGGEITSKRATADMISSYGIIHRPSLVSNHTLGTAIDMIISGVIGKKVKNKKEEEVKINRISNLNSVGATYGVHKLITDPPHWTDNGH